METKKNIILASASPRRKKLLKDAGLTFKAVESGLKESFDSRLDPKIQVEEISLKKAKFVHKRFANSIIIAADTIVVCCGKIIGKPKDEIDVKKILKLLNGRDHLVITGFTIINGDKIVTKSEKTKVTMKKISDKEINSYIQTREPFGKAGAYAIQGKARKFILGIDGDLNNVIGLPLASVLKELKKISAK